MARKESVLAKQFLEVFPALTLDDELKSLVSFTEVTALKYNRDKTGILVYLNCYRLIDKETIFELE